MKTNAGYSFCASEAAPFKKQIQTMDGRFHREIHAVNGFGLYIGVGLRTGAAEITLISFAVFPMFAGFNLTIGANHVVSLAFLLAMAHNVFGENQSEQSRLVFNKGSGVTST